MKKPTIQFIYPHPTAYGHSLSFSIENTGYVVHAFKTSEVHSEAHKFTDSELYEYYNNLVYATIRIRGFEGMYGVKNGLWEQLADKILDDISFYKPQEW